MQTFWHPPSQMEKKVQSRLLLDAVVREGAIALELLAREDESLLVGWDALPCLDLPLEMLHTV